jgi:hypothetical protein
LKFNVDPKIAAKLIKGALAVQGKTQREISEATGISGFYLSLYLNFHMSLFPDQIETLCEELGVRERAIELSSRVETSDAN